MIRTARTVGPVRTARRVRAATLFGRAAIGAAILAAALAGGADAQAVPVSDKRINVGKDTARPRVVVVPPKLRPDTVRIPSPPDTVTIERPAPPPVHDSVTITDSLWRTHWFGFPFPVPWRRTRTRTVQLAGRVDTLRFPPVILPGRVDTLFKTVTITETKTDTVTIDRWRTITDTLRVFLPADTIVRLIPGGRVDTLVVYCPPPVPPCLCEYPPHGPPHGPPPVTATPEPATFGLMAFGLVAVAGVMIRKRKR